MNRIRTRETRRFSFPAVTILAGVLALLAGCATSSKAPALKKPSGSTHTAVIPESGVSGKLPRPYQVNGVWYQPLASSRGFRQRGLASWYGIPFHGRATSSGEIYNMYGNTAAHKRLPLGTLVQVRNLENGKRIVVPVNDRGPFIPGRIIDLSYGAAMALGIVGPGTAYVEIRAVGEAPPPQSDSPAGIAFVGRPETDGYLVQVGAFSDREKAEKLVTDLNRTYRGIRVSTGPHPSASRKMYRVVVGQGDSFQAARQWAERLRADGYEDVFMVPE